MRKRIKGKVVYQNLEGGFWSIITDSGEKLIPMEMPVQMQDNNCRVECVVQFAEDDFGIFMWGKTVKILIFVLLT